jgi:chromosome segregation ATPase
MNTSLRRFDWGPLVPLGTAALAVLGTLWGLLIGRRTSRELRFFDGLETELAATRKRLETLEARGVRIEALETLTEQQEVRIQVLETEVEASTQQRHAVTAERDSLRRELDTADRRFGEQQQQHALQSVEMQGRLAELEGRLAAEKLRGQALDRDNAQLRHELGRATEQLGRR